ncbi:MAG: nicotinate phosphoribosyltransferase [Desulfobacteraceae bacterium]|nr:nicotinate phosphoribosyltransferase [Desulfobacteraceae bacterium]
MIQSILDNDLYKFTMQQAVHMLYPRAQAEYEFTNRGGTSFPDGFAQKVRQEIKKMAYLSLTKNQKVYLENTCYFFTPVYLDYLESYTYNPNEVTLGQEKGRFFLKIKGPWYRTILWEVPLMAIISETFFSMTAATFSREKIKAVNLDKAAVMSANQVRFADFGTRRRFSSTIHNYLISDILSHENHTLIGTSNVHFAQKFNITPIGTLAHEWFMFHAALAGYQMANAMAQDAWVLAYKGDLGIALADTYTTEVFLSSFDTLLAKLFDGVRQDSGDPIAFLNSLIRHYEKHHIDPTTKTIVFSDGLDIAKAVALHNECKGKIRDAYGIGTHLTNDLGVTPLNMVIKLSRCQTAPERPWQHTVKLSDDRGKLTGNKAELDTCMKQLHIPADPGKF